MPGRKIYEGAYVSSQIRLGGRVLGGLDEGAKCEKGSYHRGGEGLPGARTNGGHGRAKNVSGKTGGVLKTRLTQGERNPISFRLEEGRGGARRSFWRRKRFLDSTKGVLRLLDYNEI